MSVAAAFSPDWKQWEGEIIDGQFPLERLLAEDAGGAVFLTRFASPDGAIEAAIKIAAGGDLDGFVDRWSRAAQLDHPHLIRIFKVGRSLKAGTAVGYAITEYAEESLDMVLQGRALTPDEVLDMLGPITDVLGFLHGQGYTLAGLKSSKILAVHDTLKISSGVLAGGDRSTDLRALAATVKQVLSEGEMPGGLPEPLAEFTRKCLDRSPCSAAELGNWLRAPSGAELPVTEQGSTGLATGLTTGLTTARSKRKHALLAIAALTVALIVAANFEILHRNRPGPAASPAAPAQPAATVPQNSTTPTIPSTAPAPVREPRPRRAEGVVQRPVIRQVLPAISAKDRRTIHGTATVIVNVVVDPAGNVTEAILERGSRYFGRLATDAARQWRFASSDDRASREYYLRFEITKANIKAIVEKH